MIFIKNHGIIYSDFLYSSNIHRYIVRGYEYFILELTILIPADYETIDFRKLLKDTHKILIKDEYVKICCFSRIFKDCLKYIKIFFTIVYILKYSLKANCYLNLDLILQLIAVHMLVNHLFYHMHT